MATTPRHTIQIRPAMHYIGTHHPHGVSGTQAPEPQGYELEFYTAGEFVQRRSYSFSDADERAMSRRITQWITKGSLEDSVLIPGYPMTFGKVVA